MGKLWLSIGLFFLSSFVSGDNLLLVPQIFAEQGLSVMKSLFLAYGVVGVSVYLVCSYIGAKKGLTLDKALQIYLGPWVEKVYSSLALLVALAASGLIGGYYGGRIIYEAFGVSSYWGVFLSLSFFILLAAKRPLKLVHMINWMVPCLLIILILASLMDGQMLREEQVRDTKTLLPIPYEVLVLIGFNAGGVIPQLVTEMARSLQRNPWIAILGSGSAKVLELAFTIFFALFLIKLADNGSLPILYSMEGIFPHLGLWVMAILTLGTLGLFLGPTLTLCYQNILALGVLKPKKVYPVFFALFYTSGTLFPEFLFEFIAFGAICQLALFYSLVPAILIRDRPNIVGAKSP